MKTTHQFTLIFNIFLFFTTQSICPSYSSNRTPTNLNPYQLSTLNAYEIMLSQATSSEKEFYANFVAKESLTSTRNLFLNKSNWARLHLKDHPEEKANVDKELTRFAKTQRKQIAAFERVFLSFFIKILNRKETLVKEGRFDHSFLSSIGDQSLLSPTNDKQKLIHIAIQKRFNTVPLYFNDTTYEPLALVRTQSANGSIVFQQEWVAYDPSSNVDGVITFNGNGTIINIDDSSAAKNRP